MAPVIINLVAAQSDTGKTTVLEKLIPALNQRGLRVAALKGHLDHYELDLPGKDSWRFTRAGAEIAGVTTPTAFILIGAGKNKNGTQAAADLLQDFDLIMIEGNKRSDNPKIEVVRKAVNSRPLLPPHTIAILSDIPAPDLGASEPKLDIPVIDLEDTETLASFITEKFFSSTLDSGMDTGSLTHFDPAGRPRMVDVSAKEQTLREAYARGEITMEAQTLARIKSGAMTKGDVLSVAQVAAVMAVKETGRLIPMAHPLGISGVEVDFDLREGNPAAVEVGIRVKLTGQTGVEMEALTGVSVAALTIYDMCKAVDKNMVIQNIRLVEKRGGRSGLYRREHK